MGIDSGWKLRRWWQAPKRVASESGRRRAMEEQAIREQLRVWRREHPHATFDEIDAEVARQYAQVHAQVVAELSGADGRDDAEMQR